MNGYMDEGEFYEGFEAHLRKLYAGGRAPESIPGRNAQEEFTQWLNHLKATAWSEGFDEAMDDLGADDVNEGFGTSTNPYRETVEAPAEDRRRIPCTKDRDCILWDGHSRWCLS